MKQEDRFQWTSLKLTLLISLVFLFQLFLPKTLEGFVLNSSEVIYKPWTLLTYIFLHGSFSHLYSNMFALALFGSILEKIVGYKNFLKIFFFTGIFSGIFSTIFYTSVIGASGAVYGIMGTLAMLRPKMVVWALGVPMYMIITIVVYGVLDLAGAFFPSNIAHVGHLSALAVGILIGLLLRKRYAVFEVKREKFVLGDKEFRRWEDEYMKRRK
jgi:hypothetical protein